MHPPLDLNVTSRTSLRGIWASLAPQKFQIFYWQIILGRIHIQGNLIRRGVLLDEVSLDCVLSPRKLEVEGHLFCRCSFVGAIWYVIFKWIGMVAISLGNVVSLIDYFFTSYWVKKHRKYLMLI
jgi:hypothetical protein